MDGANKKKQIALRYHPDKQPDPEKRKEAQEVFQRYMSALTLYENKLKMPFQEAVQTGSDKVVLDVMDFTDEEKSILAEYYGMNIRNIWGNDAGAAREKYFDVIRRGSALAQKFCRLVNGNEGLKMQMYSLLKAVSGCYSITDDYIGAPRFDEEGGYTERQFADAKNQMERLWGHHFDEERILLERLESLMKQQAEKQAELAPKELKVSKKCAKPIIELEGCREYHRGKFVFGAKMTLGTTFGKVKYCNDAYVAMAPMLGVKVGQRLVLYGLGGFMFQRIVSPLVGVGIKFNLSDRFYARLEGNRWSNKKVRANVIKLGFGWRL